MPEDRSINIDYWESSQVFREATAMTLAGKVGGAIWTRRFLCILLVGVVAVGVAGFTGPGGHLALIQSRKSLESYDYSAADEWLTLAESLGCDRGESALLHARLSRKRGHLDNMASALRLAEFEGVERSRLQFEHLLAQSQIGNVAPLEARMSALLVTGEDLPEICEAFVTGCLTDYRLDEAIFVLDTWLADFPENAQAHFLRGRVLEYRNESAAAVEAYQAAINFSPQHCAARYGLGRMLTEKSTEDAIFHFQSVAEHHVSRVPGLVAIAKCQRLLGNLSDARKTLEEAIGQDEQHVELAYRLLGEPTETAFAQAPAELGQILLAEQQFALAEHWLTSAIEKNPNDWRVRYNLAMAQRQQGKVMEATDQLEKVEQTRKALEACDLAFDTLRSDPTNIEARFKVGTTLMEHVSPRQGRIWLQSVLRYSPTHEGAQRALAVVTHEENTSHK